MTSTVAAYDASVEYTEDSPHRSKFSGAQRSRAHCIGFEEDHPDIGKVS